MIILKIYHIYSLIIYLLGISFPSRYNLKYFNLLVFPNFLLRFSTFVILLYYKFIYTCVKILFFLNDSPNLSMFLIKFSYKFRYKWVKWVLLPIPFPNISIQLLNSAPSFKSIFLKLNYLLFSCSPYKFKSVIWLFDTFILNKVKLLFLPIPLPIESILLIKFPPKSILKWTILVFFPIPWPI